MRIHVSLSVKDLEASLKFYSSLFGQKASKSFSDYANFRLDQPPIHLSLIQADEVVSGHQHYGIELPDQASLDAWQQRLELTDTGLLEEPDAQCCYARGNKFWLTDPDGYRWELWVRTGSFHALGESIIDTENAACCDHSSGCA